MKNKREAIHSEFAPAAVGPYSHAVAAGDLIFLSGQVGVDPKTGALASDTIEGQTEQLMHNLQYVLAQAGVGFDRVVKTTCYLADMNDFAAFNSVYAKYFPENPPARSCVQVATLPMGIKAEVEAIAVKC